MASLAGIRTRTQRRSANKMINDELVRRVLRGTTSKNLLSFFLYQETKTGRVTELRKKRPYNKICIGVRVTKSNYTRV